MSQANHLCELWEHTIVKILKHDPNSQVGLMIKELIIFNKLENFNSLLNYTIDDFIPSHNLCYINENGEILHQTPLQEVFNLRWYIQHLIDESDDEIENPVSQENWMLQTNWKFIKYVVHNKHSMTPDQLTKKPFEQIIKIGHEELDTEEGESSKDEEESAAFSEMSEQDSASDTTADDTEE